MYRKGLRGAKIDSPNEGGFFNPFPHSTLQRRLLQTAMEIDWQPLLCGYYCFMCMHVLMHNSDSISPIYRSCTLVCWLYMYYPTVSLLLKVLSIWFFTHCQCGVFGNTRRTSGGIVTHPCHHMLHWDQTLHGATAAFCPTLCKETPTKGQFVPFLSVLHLEFWNYLLSSSNFKATKRFYSFKLHYVTITCTLLTRMLIFPLTSF